MTIQYRKIAHPASFTFVITLKYLVLINFYLSELSQDMKRRPYRLPSDNVLLAKQSSTNLPQSCILTYVFIPCDRVLLEKLPGLKLVKKFPKNLWKPKDHYHIHKCPPTVPIISEISPVHTPESHFLKTYPNMFLLFMPGSTQWSLSIRFLHQDPVQASPHPYTPYMPPISFLSIL